MPEKFAAKPYKMWIALAWEPYVLAVSVVRHSEKTYWRLDRSGRPYRCQRYERVYDEMRCVVFERKIEAAFAAEALTKFWLEFYRKDFDRAYKKHDEANQLLRKEIEHTLTLMGQRLRRADARRQ